MALFNDSSPGEPPNREERIQNIVEFWNELSIGGESGETVPGVLDEIQAKVTDYLSREPKLIARAESLTAYAALLISGQRNS